MSTFGRMAARDRFRIHTNNKVVVVLNTDLPLAYEITSFDGSERVFATQIEIIGASSWAKGPIVKKDGTRGRQVRNILAHTVDLPESILADVALLLLGDLLSDKD